MMHHCEMGDYTVASISDVTESFLKGISRDVLDTVYWIFPNLGGKGNMKGIIDFTHHYSSVIQLPWL